MDHDPSRRANGPGLASLALGFVAVLFAVVPVIGELVALAPAVAAVVLGIAGVRRHEQGRASGAWSAVGGAILGAGALAIIGLMAVALHGG
ncbi:hypothetical protein [Microbacterium excoecariae]|uniref:hypothetical protein n=1 Tax=Microbacterium excoecariae TaxID=2715210 RepID=UPI00140AD89D|nr:hypothetical protein [Microbacterium excoecariae]NHI16299.1 hypothetical protein [Microbacterium excoecariae]